MEKQKVTAKWTLCTSMVVFGTIGVLTRFIDIGSGELSLYRAILASAVVFLYLVLTKQPLRFGEARRELPLLLLSGVAMGFNWILLFEAYKFTTVSTATLCYYFAPVIVTVVSAILFREKLTKKQVLCFVMSTVGLVLIVGIGDLTASGTHLIGMLYGIGAAVLYATVILLNKAIKSVGGIQRTLLQFLASILVLLPYVLIKGAGGLATLTPVPAILLVILGVFHTGVAYCMYFVSMPKLSGQQVSILSYIDPLVAVLLSFLVLGESMTVQQMIGGALILGFAIYNELPSKK